DEECVDIINKFIEGSCRNFNKCDKIYDSWIRGVLKSARNSGFRGFGIRTLQQKDPELFKIITEVLKHSNNTDLTLPSELSDFVRDTGLSEFTYEDFRKWLGDRSSGIDASTWHHWERKLRKWAEEGYLGRKFLIGGEWVDYGSGKIEKPSSKEMRFYVP
ncbi:MAG: hypothetical protein N3G48_07635, partial [Sulfolobales archaeon]|nr:hypothetical protein [Sulfolobales archaeon]